MYVVGLTGGIGSGKSAAAAIFAKLGVSIVNADETARRVVEPGSPALKAIAEYFGEEILMANGGLDRAALRQRVFANDNERKVLESITHPAIGEMIMNFLNAPVSEGEAPYRILESPLLMETSQRHLTNRLLLIDVDEATQIRRTMERDNNTEEQVKSIIAAQMPRDAKRGMADDIVENMGTLEALEEALRVLHQRYTELARQQ